MNLRFTALLISALLVLSCAQPAKEEGWWEMRGIVLSTKELAEVDWPAIAARSGINTIGTHITPSEVVAFLNTDKGRAGQGPGFHRSLPQERHYGRASAARNGRAASAGFV